MDPKSNEIVSMQVPMWLPHEILFVLGSKLPASVWTSRAHASPLILGHLSETETKLKMPPGTLAGVGIWSDGVPFNNNRTKSLELGSMSLPCLDSDFRVISGKQTHRPTREKGSHNIINFLQNI